MEKLIFDFLKRWFLNLPRLSIRFHRPHRYGGPGCICDTLPCSCERPLDET